MTREVCSKIIRDCRHMNERDVYDKYRYLRKDMTRDDYSLFIDQAYLLSGGGIRDIIKRGTCYLLGNEKIQNNIITVIQERLGPNVVMNNVGKITDIIMKIAENNMHLKDKNKMKTDITKMIQMNLEKIQSEFNDQFPKLLRGVFESQCRNGNQSGGIGRDDIICTISNHIEQYVPSIMTVIIKNLIEIMANNRDKFSSDQMLQQYNTPKIIGMITLILSLVVWNLGQVIIEDVKKPCGNFSSNGNLMNNGEFACLFPQELINEINRKMGSDFPTDYIINMCRNSSTKKLVHQLIDNLTTQKQNLERSELVQNNYQEQQERPVSFYPSPIYQNSSQSSFLPVKSNSPFEIVNLDIKEFGNRFAASIAKHNAAATSNYNPTTQKRNPQREPQRNFQRNSQRNSQGNSQSQYRSSSSQRNTRR